jgi:hypothetical protein
MRLNTVFASSVLLSTSLIACMRGDSDSLDTAASAVDSQESVSDESDLMVSAVDGASATGLAPLTGDQVAATIAANISARWPGGCAVVTQAGADITVKYTDCTGPRGLVHVTGELDLTVTIPALATIAVHGSASGLQVNSATLDFDLDATYTTSGTTSTLAVTANGSGTGPRGNSIDHNGNYTVTWDTASACRTIDGAWSTDLTSAAATAERSNTVNLSRCDSSCPTGSLTHKFLAGASLTITFDGSSTAQWSASTGASGSVPLLCTPAV